MQLGKFSFVFGLGFLKAVNKKYSALAPGNLPFRYGLETILINIGNKDVETLVETLMLANQTEKPKATEKDIENIIMETEDMDELFKRVIEALEESNFTKEKTKAKLSEMMKELNKK